MQRPGRRIQTSRRDQSVPDTRRGRGQRINRRGDGHVQSSHFDDESDDVFRAVRPTRALVSGRDTAVRAQTGVTRAHAHVERARTESRRVFERKPSRRRRLPRRGVQHVRRQV